MQTDNIDDVMAMLMLCMEAMRLISDSSEMMEAIRDGVFGARYQTSDFRPDLKEILFNEETPH